MNGAGGFRGALPALGAAQGENEGERGGGDHKIGQIAGAALDVYDTEPLPLAHALRTLPNTVLTPHLGYVTDEIYQVFYRDAVEDIAAFVNGSPVRVLND